MYKYPTPAYIRKAYEEGTILSNTRSYEASGHGRGNLNLSDIATTVVQYTARFVESNVLNALRLWRIVEEELLPDAEVGDDSIVLFALRKDGVDDINSFEEKLMSEPYAHYPVGEGANLFPMRVYRSLLAVRVTFSSDLYLCVEARELMTSGLSSFMRMEKPLKHDIWRDVYPMTFSFYPFTEYEEPYKPDQSTINMFEKADSRVLAVRDISMKDLAVLSPREGKRPDDMVENIAAPIIHWVGRLAERYASDVLIDWNCMMNSIIRAKSGDDMMFVFAIRDSGVDGIRMFMSRMSEAAKRSGYIQMASPSEVYRKAFLLRAQANSQKLTLELRDITNELYKI